MLPPPPPSTLFPYTTLFRSRFGRGEPVPDRGEAWVEQHFARDRLVHAARLLDLPRLEERAQVVVAGRVVGGIRRHGGLRSEEHTSELQSRFDLVCRLLLEKK